MRGWLLVVILALVAGAMACGEVDSKKPDAAVQRDAPPGGTSCVLDQSTVDNCTL